MINSRKYYKMLAQSSIDESATLTVAHKDAWIFRCREVAQALHGLMLAARNLVTSCLAHLWRIAPIVLSCEHVNWTFLGVCVVVSLA